MNTYHAIMQFFGEEFGVTFDANNKAEAYSILKRDYPESRCVHLEDCLEEKFNAMQDTLLEFYYDDDCLSV